MSAGDAVAPSKESGPVAFRAQVEPLEIQTSGDQAFVWVRFSGHGAESGIPIDMELAHIVTVKGGKILRVEEYSDRADGLEAVGLPE